MLCNAAENRCFFMLEDKTGEPPVKAIISVRSQVLLQLVVGLLDLPAEVFQLAVQRVFQAGGVVVVHYHHRKWRWGGGERPPHSRADGDRCVLSLRLIESAAQAVLFVSLQRKKEKKSSKKKKKNEKRGRKHRGGESRGQSSAPRTETDRDTCPICSQHQHMTEIYTCRNTQESLTSYKKTQV